MISYYIGSSDNAGRLVRLCRKYDFDIDIMYGRYIIDGKSILGVMSLVGNTVGIDLMTYDENIKEEFKKKLYEEVK